ncbi:hypothetical protein ACLB2K_002855 [Fragaria x ananassa]
MNMEAKMASSSSSSSYVVTSSLFSFCFVFSFCFFFSSVSSASSIDLNYGQTFAHCIGSHSSNNLSNLVYGSDDRSFSTVFHSSIQNLRFYNTTPNQNPQSIITPYNFTHVQAAIICSKKLGLQVRIRSGGHDYEGLSYKSDVPFIIIDLVNLNNVRVDNKEATAWVQSGATLGELYYHVATNSTGSLGFPGGTCPSVGVGGQISGGGQGMLVRKFGLAADNVVDAIVVNADGKVLDRQAMGEDWFWAIRGSGGGSFGVVVEWKIALVHVPNKVTGFNIPKTLENNATKLVHLWQQISHQLHEDLFIRIIFFVVQDSQGVATIQANFNALFLGTIDQLVPLIGSSFPELGLKAEDCGEMSWIESILATDGISLSQPLEVLLDRNQVQKGFFKSKTDFVTEPISETDLKSLWKVMLEGSSEAGVMLWDPYGGKMSEISESSIPFPHRAGLLYNIQYFSKWQNGEALVEERRLDWINRVYNFMGQFVTKNPRTAYVNYRDLDIVNFMGRFFFISFLRAVICLYGIL